MSNDSKPQRKPIFGQLDEDMHIVFLETLMQVGMKGMEFVEQAVIKEIVFRMNQRADKASPLARILAMRAADNERALAIDAVRVQMYRQMDNPDLEQLEEICNICDELGGDSERMLAEFINNKELAAAISPDGRIDPVVQLITEILPPGKKVKSTTMYAIGLERGINKLRMNKARDKLGIEPEHGKQGKNEWYWSRPMEKPASHRNGAEESPKM